MRIAMLGATGYLGSVILRKALEQGHEVTALVRSPKKLGALRESVTVVEGDMFDPAALSSLVRGAEAVVSAAGPPQRAPGDPEQYGRAMEELVKAAREAGCRRIVATGGAAHLGGKGEAWNFGRLLLRGFLLLLARPILTAKEREWSVLRDSGLDWTLIRPPRITDGRRRRTINADEKRLAGLEVNVESLAEFTLGELSEARWIGKAPLVASA